MTDMWGTQEATTLSCVAPHSQHGLWNCTCVYNLTSLGNLGSGSLCLTVLSAWQGGFSLWKWIIPGNNELLEKWHKVELQSPKLRTVLMAWRKLALFCILPCKMFPLAFQGDLLQEKNNWVLFLQLLAYQNYQGNGFARMWSYHSLSLWAIPSLQEPGKTKGKWAMLWVNTLETHTEYSHINLGAIQWMNTLGTHTKYTSALVLSNGWIHWEPIQNTHISALVLTVPCNASILCNTMPHL